MYCDDFRDFVPEEGNSLAAINNPGSPGPTGSADNLHTAWYNVCTPYVALPSLVQLYMATNAPIPSSASIFSCPSCASPDPNIYPNYPPLKTAKAFFMYGENNRLCVNFGTVASGATQTKLGTLPKPSATVFIAEQDPNTTGLGAAESGVTERYAVARHGKVGNFALCDGSSRSAHTNDFEPPSSIGSTYSTAAVEWSAAPHPALYWWPTPTTQQ
jgi:hypothetical protein